MCRVKIIVAYIHFREAHMTNLIQDRGNGLAIRGSSIKKSGSETMKSNSDCVTLNKR